MSTLNLTSTSQVEVLLAHLYQVMTAQNWNVYIRLMHSILHSRSEDGLARFALNRFLLQERPVVMLLHQMIKQELSEDAARTPPPVLGDIYPWNEVSGEVAEAFMLMAQRRKDANVEPQDAANSQKLAIALVAAELALYRGISKMDDDLAKASGTMGIIGDAAGVTEEETAGLMDSMNIK